jgi:hypothetical protein
VALLSWNCPHWMAENSLTCPCIPSLNTMINFFKWCLSSLVYHTIIDEFTVVSKIEIEIEIKVWKLIFSVDLKKSEEKRNTIQNLNSGFEPTIFSLCLVKNFW